MNKMKSIGIPKKQIKSMFILPTPPKGMYDLDGDGHLNLVSVNHIIKQDGNHWRKVLTIMAKLCALQYTDWKQYRDEKLLHNSERIEFSLPSVFDENITYFICGGYMQSQLKVEQDDITSLNEKDTVKIHGNKILCPYLDYRQYPNADIEITRMYLSKIA